jgi:hypothetical protein
VESGRLRSVLQFTVSNRMDMDQFVHLEPIIHLQDLLLYLLTRSKDSSMCSASASMDS